MFQVTYPVGSAFQGRNAPEVADEVAAAGATRCPVKPRAAGAATHAEHPAHPARTAAAVAAFLDGAIFD